MIRSMTGYGQGESSPDEVVRFKAELRSVNHRYLDVSIRMPREIQFLEDKVRRLVQHTVSRGRVDILISMRDDADDSVKVFLNQRLAKAYHQALVQMCELCSLEEQPGLEMLSRFPDVLRVEKEQADADKIWAELESVLKHGLENLLTQRSEEGARLITDFLMRLNVLAAAAKKVEVRGPVVVEDYRKRMADRLHDLLSQVEIDPGRVLTEVAIFADRSNVTEELVRLGSHITAFRDVLQEKVAVGRKLDFLTQELFREINTIGSKANDYEVAKLVVEMKTELEKIREQVQNIE